LPLNFTTTDKASVGHGIKALVFGRAGSGKTSLAGTAPSPLIISAEAGLLSLRGKKIPVLQVTSAQDVWDALNWCRSEAIKSGIQTVCLDSISEITETILANEKKKTKDPRAAYGEMANQTLEMVKAFRDLPGLHVLVTAKEITNTDPVTGASRAQPTAPGQQVGPALPYLFDLVLHAATDKDRSGILDEIEYPDFTNIVTKITGGKPA
jgi:hypothetical protein